ncbi:MAG: hypothetical protein COB98_07935 [Flavobacteriaceae bacterium]|nr:MAG: hypothetical protein COB98_07935 [Flavobacteriaceae bacterium]
MRKIFFLALSTLLISCSNKKEEFVKEIQQFQYVLNVHYSDANESPLTPQDLKNFKSLTFFEINESFSVVANFIETPDTDIFEMATTSDRRPLYRKYGIATFELNGEKQVLNLYQNQQFMTSPEYGNSLFVPYTDLTNSETSYGGGRYIDVEIPADGATSITIDFNKSYNPYCAYNKKYSCPIVPAENNLNVKIEAGVRKFKAH